MQSSAAVVRPILSKDSLAKQEHSEGMATDEMNRSKPRQVDKTEQKDDLVAWGSEAFVSQLNEQKSRLVSTKRNPRILARSESLPSRLSPFIERRTVRELAELLEGKIPIPVFREEEEKQMEESSLSLAEQLSRQMNRLNTVYTPETKQKMFFQKSASMPCSSPAQNTAEVSSRRSVAELSVLLQLKIPGLMETNVEEKKVHSKNAASSTTSFVATKIDNYVDTATRRPLIQKADSMPLNQSVRQLANQLRHRIPMTIPQIAHDNVQNITKLRSSPRDLTGLAEDADHLANDSNEEVTVQRCQRGLSIEGNGTSCAMQSCHRSRLPVVSPLKKSRSVAELSSLRKDRIPIRGNRRDNPVSNTSPTKIQDNTSVHSDRLSESFAKQESSNNNHDVQFGGRNRQGGDEALLQIPQGAVREVAAELKKKLVFPLHKGANTSSVLSTSAPVRAEEAVNSIKRGLVRTVALDLVNKLVFRSINPKVNDLVSLAQTTKELKSADSDAEDTSHIHTSSVLAMAMDLQGKLRFRSGDGRNQSPLENKAESHAQKQPDAVIQQVRKGSVQAVAASLKHKLFFLRHNEGTGKRTNEAMVATCKDDGLPHHSQVHEDGIRESSRHGSVHKVSVLLKEKLVFRQQQKGTLQQDPPRQAQGCRLTLDSTFNVAPTLERFEIGKDNASETQVTKAASKESFPPDPKAKIRQCGKSMGSQTESEQEEKYQQLQNRQIEAFRCTNPAYLLCSHCEMVIDQSGKTLATSKRPLRVDSTTQTDVALFGQKLASTIDPATQRKAMIQWRKRSAARSIVKRQPGKTVASVSFAEYGKKSNCSARKVPKRRWVATPVTWSSIRAGCKPQTDEYGPVKKIDVTTKEIRDAASGGEANFQVEERQMCEQDHGAKSTPGDTTETFEDTGNSQTVQTSDDCRREHSTTAISPQEPSDGIGKMACLTDEVQSVNCHVPATMESPSAEKLVSPQESASCTNDESKEAPPAEHVESEHVESKGGTLVGVQTHQAKQRPPLRRRNLPIIDPIETALCQVLVGQTFRESFRESSQTRIVAQDPLDSAITDALADVSNRRSWCATKRVL